MVICQGSPIDFYGHIAAQGGVPGLSSDFPDLIPGQRADLCQRVWVVSGMVEQTDVFVSGRPFFSADPNQILKSFFT